MGHSFEKPLVVGFQHRGWLALSSSVLFPPIEALVDLNNVKRIAAEHAKRLRRKGYTKFHLSISAGAAASTRTVRRIVTMG